jgi:hypothetical protein
MPGGLVDIHVDLHGPVFEGLAEEEMNNFSRHIEDVLGDEAVTRIRAYLPTQYMYLGNNGGTPEFNPVPPDAGRLEASIQAQRMATDLVQVNDSNILYGPWIEGIAAGNEIVWEHRRNPPPRRFPGYSTFRMIGQQLEGESGVIAERELAPYLAAMNA